MSGCLTTVCGEAWRVVKNLRPVLSPVPRSLLAPSSPIEFAVCSIPCMCRR
jgi:hypothetical protein